MTSIFLRAIGARTLIACLIAGASFGLATGHAYAQNAGSPAATVMKGNEFVAAMVKRQAAIRAEFMRNWAQPAAPQMQTGSSSHAPSGRAGAGNAINPETGNAAALENPWEDFLQQWRASSGADRNQASGERKGTIRSQAAIAGRDGFVFMPRNAVKPAQPAQPSITGRSSHDALIAHYAAANGVPLDLAHAVITVESNYRSGARGAAGEIGLMQIKPATARMMGYSGSTKGLYDPETNLRWGMKYLGEAHRLAGGSTCGTILKYNAGHGAKSMNPVSANYCKKVQRII